MLCRVFKGSRETDVADEFYAKGEIRHKSHM